MILRCRNHARRLLLLACYVAFVAKAVIPIGYMPASLSDGFPVRLCDALPAGKLLSDHDAHRDHVGDESDKRWEHCPLGALAGAASVPSAYEVYLSRPRYGVSAAGDEIVISSAPAIGFRSRAPPSVTSVS
jgi:hypothetical protein